MKKINAWFYLLFSVLFLVFLSFNSALPPTGNVWNEQNTAYWGLVVNIAEKWRALNFSFWDPQIGGGVSLYTSAFYPIFNPTNALAFFLDNDHFYVFKIMEPYICGAFAMVLFLTWVGVRKIYSACAAIIYLTLSFAIWSNISIQSAFIWGPALFPIMLYAFFKNTKNSSMTVGAIWVGIVIAVQFLVGGMPQILQMLFWWLCFFIVRALFYLRSWSYILEIIKAYILIVGSFIITAAYQLIPTIAYFWLDAAKMSGRYPINTLRLWGTPHSNFPSLTWIFKKNNEWLNFDAGLLLLGIIGLLLVLNVGRIKRNIESFKGVLAIVLASTLYLTIPSMAETLAANYPVLTKFLNPISSFNFSYGLYVLDFSVILLVCYLINLKGNLSAKNSSGVVERWLSNIGSFLAFAAFVFVIVITCQIIFKKTPQEVIPVLFTRGEKFFVLLCAWSALGLGLLSFSVQRNTIAKTIFVIVLFWTGSSHLLGSYHLLGRGYASAPQRELYLTPEHKFFVASKDKYSLLSASYGNCLSMGDHYNLNYGVRGLSRALPIPSHRFAKFQAAYNYQLANKYWAQPVNFLNQPSASLISYFPVDFSIIEHDKPIDWPGFKKVVAGRECDVWANDQPAWKLRLANQIEVLDFENIVERMRKKPFNDTLLIDKEDFKNFYLPPPARYSVHAAKKYSDYQELRGDYITFKVNAQDGSYVIFPQMFHHGWQAWIDGKRENVFPADFIFIGVHILAGVHDVVLKFYPPGIILGIIVFVFGMPLLLFMIRKIK